MISPFSFVETSDVIDPRFQVALIGISALIIAFAIYKRLSRFESRDSQPTIKLITPKKLAELGGYPTIIHVGLYINKFEVFDVIHNNFIFTGVIWFESNLGALSLETLERFHFEQAEILERSEPDMQLIDEKLMIRYTIRVKFSSPLNYSLFPLDDHQLSLVMTHPFVSPGEVVFQASQREFIIKPSVKTFGWYNTNSSVLTGYKQATLDPYNQEKTQSYPVVAFSLGYERYGMRFTLLVLLPQILLFYLSTFCFSIEEQKTIIGLATACITGILGYRFVIERLSPFTGYFMVSDYLFFLFLGGTGSVFVISLLENFLSHVSVYFKQVTIGLVITIVTAIAIYYILMWTQKRYRSLWGYLTNRFPWQFYNLTEMITYAKNYPENPKADNDDWLDPDYTTFYKSLMPGIIPKLLFKIGLKNNPAAFLKQTVIDREKAGLSGRNVASLLLEKPARLIVWSDIHGGFHSLVRSLTALRTEGVINDKLELLKPDHYLVFNGDCIDREPYSIEVLHTIMLLIKKNGEKVFYIRGKHEDNNYWHDFGLRRDLEIRARALSDERIPLASLLSRFFQTLPLALYIRTTDTPSDVIRISHAGRDWKEVNEKYFGDFLFSKEPGITYYDTKEKVKSPTLPSVKAIIESEDWMKENRARNGLGLLDQDLGATAWSIVSTPTQIHRIQYHFHFDAFAVIDAQLPVMASTITLYNYDTSKKDASFEKHPPLNIRTGGPAQETWSAQQDLYIGSSLSLVNGVPIMGQRIRLGMSLCINQVNKQGGIHGHHIKNTVYNDDYTPRWARKNIIRLATEKNTKIILLPTGSPTLSAYIDYAQENNLLILFPVSGSSAFRSPELTSIINYRPSYAEEVNVLMDHVITEFGAKKFAFFYQNDAYGIPANQAAKEVLKSYGIDDITEIPYLRGSVDFKEQAEMIRRSQPDAIGLFSAAAPTLEFIRQIGIEELANKQLFGISFLGEESIRLFAQQHGLAILWGAVVPNPNTSQLEIAQEYRTIMDQNNAPYDVFSLESYICTSILIKMLNQIEGPMNVDTVKMQLESLNEVNFKGLNLNFDPQRRSLARYVWIETGKDKDWLEKRIVIEKTH